MPDPSNEPHFRNEVFRQSEALASLPERAGELRDLVGDLARYRRVVAFGCGDSYVAAQACEAAFARVRVPFRALPALEFLAYTGRESTADDLAIPISMSGNVDRTVAGMALAQKRGATTLAITNAADGRLAQGADRVFDLGFSEPASFLSSTVSYTATIAALQLLARLAAGDGDTGAPALVTAIDAMAAAARAAADAVPRVAAEHHEAARVFLLATGPNLATATHGAMKFAELTDTLALAQELEEFAHQQFWLLQRSDLVVILVEEGGPAELAAHFVTTLAEYGVATVVVSQVDGVGAHARHAIRVPATGDGTQSPLPLAVPLQLLAYEWSLRRGMNPNTRAHLKEDEARFITSRKLTRTSLVGTGR